MTRASALPVHTACHNQPLEPGHVYIGPGNVHLRLDDHGRVALNPAPMTVHRPSADELFSSVAEHAGPNGVGVVLTGMGDDGMAGARAIRARGGRIMAEAESTCVVYGMPRAVIENGLANDIVPLDGMAAAIAAAVTPR